ncbi:hypothetical protein GmHk_14G041129 [Glycine max]|nr:hypothetical protein GmHk_14G041129 [Glycine max]
MIYRNSKSYINEHFCLLSCTLPHTPQKVPPLSSFTNFFFVRVFSLIKPQIQIPTSSISHSFPLFYSNSLSPLVLFAPPTTLTFSLISSKLQISPSSSKHDFSMIPR